jgi:NAD(P)-dependent dehydrogenase (short-subunit alcohol dehydrogenase family)
MDRVKNKVALVTGGALGIGRATCRLLAREGARVAIADLLEREREELVREISSAGGQAEGWTLDVTDEAAVKSVVAEVEKRFGPITVLVNNAGIAGKGGLTHETSLEDWQQVIDVNQKGVFLCTKHVVPSMIRAGGGSIINLSSILGLVGAPAAGAYSASKGAVRLMTKTDALQYAAKNIRVNSIHPGYVRTSLVENYLKTRPDPAAAERKLTALHPLGRLANVEDIAYGVLYLASDESSFVTGSELVIDGGYTAR